MFEIPRRRFLAGLIGLIAAPAIVRVTSLMPVKALPLVVPMEPLDVGVTLSWGDVVTMKYDRHGLWRYGDDPIVGGIDRSPQTWWKNPAEQEGEGLRLPLQA